MNSYSLGLGVGIVCGLAVWAIFNVAKKRDKRPDEFDERQRLERGKAYEHAFFSVMAFSAIYGMLIMVLERPLMADGVSALLALFVGVAVFAVESVARDAFFTAKNRPKTYIILYVVCILSQLAGVVGHFRAHDLIADGVLQMSVLPLACAVTFAAVLAAILVKTLRGAPEED